MKSLDVDFEELVKSINDKIKEAAKLLEEANDLAQSKGYPALNDRYGDYEDNELSKFYDEVDIYPLLNKLNDAGWRTSSIGC